MNHEQTAADLAAQEQDDNDDFAPLDEDTAALLASRTARNESGFKEIEKDSPETVSKRDAAAIAHDQEIVTGWLAPPPEYDTDPITYRRTRQISRLGTLGGMLSTLTVAYQGMVVTPDLIMAYASAGEWFTTLAAPHAAILLPTVLVGYLGKRSLRTIEATTDRKPLPIESMTRTEHRRMKEIFRRGTFDEKEALRNAVWAAAKAEHEAKQKAEAEAARARKIAARIAEEKATNAEQARALVKAAMAEERAAEAAAHEESLDLATARHEEIREAWTAIITDPLAALEHSSLFDVGDRRTAAFVTAYGEIEDLVAVYRSGIPATLASSYAEKVRECQRLWDDALVYSTKRSYSWLPEAEADMARKAAGLLARSVGEPGAEMTPEQILSARKALDLLAKITTVTLPKTARGVIEATARLEITA